MNDFPQIVLKGSPYEKGFTHGSLCKEQVLCSLKSYRARFLSSMNLSWEDAEKLALRFLPVFTGKYEKYLDEMRGIADGAGVRFEDILILNLRTELISSGLSSLKDEDDEEHECSAFSALPPATKDGVVLAGQSWDYMRCQRGAVLIARFEAEDGIPQMLTLLEGGMVGGKGMNSAGISLTLNALSCSSFDIGVPLHIRMRRALESSNINDAYAEAAVSPIPSPANLIITSKDGLSLDLELDPSGCDVLQPENGIIVHTNHFTGPRMVLNHKHSAIGSSYLRYQRLRQLLSGKKELELTDIEGFFRDHAAYPVSICVHMADEAPADKRELTTATNYAFICDLTNGVMYYAPGNPCESEYRVLRF